MTIINLSNNYEIRYNPDSSYIWASLYNAHNEHIATAYNGDGSEGLYGEWRIQNLNESLCIPAQDVIEIFNNYLGVQ